MNDSVFTGHTKFGTLGGILTVFLVNIQSGDLLRTAILAATGAVVSFGVSFGLKYCLKKWRR